MGDRLNDYPGSNYPPGVSDQSFDEEEEDPGSAYDCEVVILNMAEYWLVHVTTYYPYPNRASSRYHTRGAAYQAAITALRASAVRETGAQ